MGKRVSNKRGKWGARTKPKIGYHRKRQLYSVLGRIEELQRKGAVDPNSAEEKEIKGLKGFVKQLLPRKQAR